MPNATASIAQKMGQQANSEIQQPGTMTDTLTTALKSLQAYTKMASEINSADPDVSLVRKIIMAISSLIQKDQQEGQGGVETKGIPNMGATEGVAGRSMGTMGGMGTQAPIQPDLSQFTQIKV